MNFWVSIFGHPQQIITASNHHVFGTEDFWTMSRFLDVTLYSVDDAKYLGLESLGTYNQTLCDKIKSILSNIDCSITVAVTWAANFINSEPNILGFSPSECVFGFNLILPCVCNNPPNLSQQGYKTANTGFRKHLFLS